jgi:hypothetical protein
MTSSISFQSVMPDRLAPMSSDGLLYAVNLLMAVTGQTYEEASKLLTSLEQRFRYHPYIFTLHHRLSGRLISAENALKLIQCIPNAVLPPDQAVKFMDILNLYISGDRSMVCPPCQDEPIQTIQIENIKPEPIQTIQIENIKPEPRSYSQSEVQAELDRLDALYAKELEYERAKLQLRQEGHRAELEHHRAMARVILDRGQFAAPQAETVTAQAVYLKYAGLLFRNLTLPQQAAMLDEAEQRACLAYLCKFSKFPDRAPDGSNAFPVAFEPDVLDALHEAHKTVQRWRRK